MSENGRDATGTAHAEAAATIGDALAVDVEAVPEHIRRVLDDEGAPSVGYRVVRATAVAIPAVLLLAGVAWSAGLVPGSLPFVP